MEPDEACEGDEGWEVKEEEEEEGEEEKDDELIFAPSRSRVTVYILP